MSVPRPPQPLAGSRAQDALRTVKGEYMSFIAGVLEVVDGVERWMASESPQERDRLRLLHRQMMSLLLRHGVLPTPRTGEGLDLRYHEVVATLPTSEVPPDTVVEIHQTGYLMGDTLIRRARVVVSTGPVHQQEEVCADE